MVRILLMIVIFIGSLGLIGYFSSVRGIYYSVITFIIGSILIWRIYVNLGKGERKSGSVTPEYQKRRRIASEKRKGDAKRKMKEKLSRG